MNNNPNGVNTPLTQNSKDPNLAFPSLYQPAVKAKAVQSPTPVMKPETTLQKPMPPSDLPLQQSRRGFDLQPPMYKQQITQTQAPQPATTQTTTPQVTPPQMATPQVTTPQAANPQVIPPQMATPQVTAPQASTPQVTAPQIITPQITTPQMQNATLDNLSNVTNVLEPSNEAIINEQARAYRGATTPPNELQTQIVRDAFLTQENEAARQLPIAGENRVEPEPQPGSNPNAVQESLVIPNANPETTQQEYDAANSLNAYLHTSTFTSPTAEDLENFTETGEYIDPATVTSKPPIIPYEEHLNRNTGEPIYNDTASLTTEQPSFTLLSDTFLTEKLFHFNRERIPERVVHAKGAGAFGEFVVTNDLSRFTSANFLSKIGKRTPVLARFSTVGGEKGSADTVRDPRGFAVKFYTEEGNYDLVGNNTPVFFIRDAMKFPDFIHTQKRNPITNLKDPDAVWDFFSLLPETMHQVTILYSDAGTPTDFRHMDGHGTHTFMWYNNLNNDYVWVKYHFLSKLGLRNFNSKQATEMAGIDPDHSVRDLYENIDNGNYPSWGLFVQIMTPEQAKKYRFDIFDVTKIWYEEDFPLIPVGFLVLSKVPDNFFAEIEQAAFSPGNFVPGIGPSPDKMLNARIVSYPDAQRYRLGVNFHQLPVNMPKQTTVTNYQRDGAMAYYNGGEPNYYPNSFQGVTPVPRFRPPVMEAVGDVARFDVPFTDIDLVQPRRLYNDVLTDIERAHLISNIADDLGKAEKRLQLRQCALFYLTSKDYGTRVANALGLDLTDVITLSSLPQIERISKTS